MCYIVSRKVLVALFSSFVCASFPSCRTQSSTSDSFLPEAPTEQVDGQTTKQGYTTAVGDSLDIFVREDSSFDGHYIVRPSGDIILPKAGRVFVLNMTLSEVEAAVKKVLEGDQLTKATVIADPVRRGAGDGKTVLAGLTVYLSGNVMQRGRVVVPFIGNAQVTAFQAITDAGGFSAFANKRKSYLLRRDSASGRPKRVPVDFAAIERGEAPDPVLMDGDTIVVPQKIIGF